MGDEEEEYLIPLQEQRLFGGGIQRKRVQFIPSTSGSPTGSSELTTSSRAGDRYLSVVLSRPQSDPKQNLVTGKCFEGPTPQTPSTIDSSLCQICNLPLPPHNSNAKSSSQLHEASLAHQVCLAHSHPPSHIDRNRQGLKYLSSYGWDPDSRVGLGAGGHGIRSPIKPKPKNNTVGLGADMSLGDRRDSRNKNKKEKKLDAGNVRKRERESKLKTAFLQELFYGSEDMEKYLRPGKVAQE